MSATAIPLLTALDAVLSNGATPLADRGPEWIRSARRAAAAWVARHGFPTRRDEDWRYTRVDSIVATPFGFAVPETGRRLSRSAVEALIGERPPLTDATTDGPSDTAAPGAQLVFVNGHYAPECSRLPAPVEGLTITTLASALLDERADVEPLLADPAPPLHAFTALNAALWEDGAFIRLAPQTKVEEPIRLVFVTDGRPTPTAAYPRSVILAGAESVAQIVELHVSTHAGATFADAAHVDTTFADSAHVDTTFADTAHATRSLIDAVTHVVLDQGAQLEYTTVQHQDEAGFYLGLLDVRQAESSTFTGRSFAIGAAIARHEVRVDLQGEGASANLDGLYVPRGRQHHDNPVVVEHRAPHTRSRQFYKGVVGERGHGVFNGHLIVHAGAVGTDAGQRNKNLLLSDHAEVDTRPRLEIRTDDVKCVHGAFVGQLDEEAVFYLRSRGLTNQAARDLLSLAFANEIVQRIPLASLRTFVSCLVADHVAGAAGNLAP